jgi:alpha-beta hydrolase superfamily lysophospholipase
MHRITRARVLLTLSGFASVVNGLIELGPDARPAVKPVGVALIVIGLLTWAIVAWMRRPGPATVALTAAIAATLVAAWLAQFALLHSPAILLAIALPIVALWLVARCTQAQKPSKAVPITAGLLVVVTGAALAVALVPANLPASANVAALKDDQSRTSPPEPEPTGYVTATDGTQLAYFADVPTNPVAALVFYHGSGANAGAGYLDFSKHVAEQYHVATYLFDMRGHGKSGGPRGDAPSQDQMFADTQTAVDFVKHTHPQLPEYVGGHSAGAGLVLNSENRIDHEIAGYVYLAPDFGLHSGTEVQSDGSNFATISHRPLIVDVVTSGLLDAHTYAVSFAYTQEEINRAGLVSRYTTTMAIAQNAADSATILAGTHKPVGVWIGSDDEVLDASKVLTWARNAPQVTTGTVTGADHLGVIDRSVTDVGTWLDRQAAKPATPTVRAGRP